jgi:DNA-binding Lrp family transcriptional regulator
MKLDDIDKVIINALMDDGRKSLMQISEFLHESNNNTMSHTGIRKRINKLKNGEILSIQGNINMNALQYKAAFILMEMKNFNEVKKIVDCYTGCPRVFLLAQITGQYNLILGFVGQNMDIMHRYLNLCGPTNKEGILHSAVVFVSNFETPKYFPLNVFQRESQEKTCGNICKDCAAFIDGICTGCGRF